MNSHLLKPFACAALASLALIVVLGQGSGKASRGRKATPSAIVQEANRQLKQGAPKALNVVNQVMDICSDSPIPSGWVKVNDGWNPTVCGNPSSIIYNVTTIYKYADDPVGRVLDVCSDARIPNGWVKIGGRWNPTCCGYPSYIKDNVITIKRVN